MFIVQNVHWENLNYFIHIICDLLNQNQSLIKKLLFKFVLYSKSAPSRFFGHYFVNFEIKKKHCIALCSYHSYVSGKVNILQIWLVCQKLQLKAILTCLITTCIPDYYHIHMPDCHITHVIYYIPHSGLHIPEYRISMVEMVKEWLICMFYGLIISDRNAETNHFKFLVRGRENDLLKLDSASPKNE